MYKHNLSELIRDFLERDGTWHHKNEVIDDVAFAVPPESAYRRMLTDLRGPRGNHRIIRQSMEARVAHGKQLIINDRLRSMTLDQKIERRYTNTPFTEYRLPK